MLMCAYLMSQVKGGQDRNGGDAIVSDLASSARLILILSLMAMMATSYESANYLLSLYVWFGYTFVMNEGQTFL